MNGINPKDQIGLKKVSLSKIPVAGLIHEAMAMKDGAAKYGPHNWRENPVIGTVYVDAALRHIFAWFDGENEAADSGVHHLGHAKACLGILLDAMETGNLDDDRPIPGKAAEMFEQFAEKAAPTFILRNEALLGTPSGVNIAGPYGDPLVPEDS